jgi:hypothetical protein
LVNRRFVFRVIVIDTESSPDKSWTVRGAFKTRRLYKEPLFSVRKKSTGPKPGGSFRSI